MAPRIVTNKTFFEERSVLFCPRCQVQFVRQQGTGDYEHVCQDTAVLSEESIPIIGNWQDYTGSDFNVQRRNMAGLANTLQGTRGQIEGGKSEERDVRGYPTSRYRTRKHIETVPVSEFETEKSSTSNPEEYPD